MGGTVHLLLKSRRAVLRRRASRSVFRSSLHHAAESGARFDEARTTTNVLILCTHNSARSVLGEAMLNHLASKRGKDVRAFSAGSTPSGRLNPFATEALTKAGIGVSGYRSKSWDEFARDDAPPMRIVITVCDSAAAETCPFWPGSPVRMHCGYADPSNALGGDEGKLQQALNDILQS